MKMERLPRATRVIFFDYGDTLAYADPTPEVIWQAFMREAVGIDVSLTNARAVKRDIDARLLPQWKQIDKEHMKDFWLLYNQLFLEGLGLGTEHARHLASQANERFDATKFGWVPFPETQKVLSALREYGYRLGIISNHTDAIIRQLTNLGLHTYFESVTYSEEVGSEKPDPGIFRVALGRMACAPHEAAHVGDLFEADVLGARAVGITPVLIDRRGIFPDADCLRINDLQELPNRL